MKKKKSMKNLSAVTDIIRDRVSAKDAAVALGIRVNRYRRCQCPIHHGQDYNMVVYSDNRGWYCHRCKTGGDVIRLVERVNECTFPEAVGWLNSAFQLGLPLDGKESEESRKDAQIAKKRRQIERELKEAVRDELLETYLNAGELVFKLEDMKEDFRPVRWDEEWKPEFVAALRLLPEARELAAEALMAVIGTRD